MKNLNVLVTGADGFIGSHLCEELVKQGFHVKVLVAYNSFNSIGWLNDLSKRKLKSIEIIFGDIRDADLINKISRKINIIFHLAALIAIPYSYRAPRSYIETNVLGTLNILQACMNNSIYKLISTSTSEVYGTAKYTPIDEKHILQAQSPYAASKIAADHLIESYYKTYKVPAVILRPFNTYGPRQSERAVIPTVIRQIIDPNCKKIKIGDTSPIRDFNFVKDTANAFIKLASANNVEYGNAYNAGSGRSVSIGETIKIINKITKNKKVYETSKERLRPQTSEVFNLIASSKKLELLTGWKPKTSLESGLEKTITWWKKNLNKNIINNSSDYKI